jgi:hypothetical protein
MFSTLQSNDRQRLLGMAFDLPCTVYAVGPVNIRPFSLNAHRRAEALGLSVVSGGIETAREYLSPAAFLRELDALYWLLSAKLERVQQCFRKGPEKVWEELRFYTLPPGALGPFSEEMAQVLRISRAALFDLDERDLGEGTGPGDSPPDLLRPGLVASLVVSLSERLRVSDEHILEMLPFPRALQYMHAIHWINPTVWTISPRAITPDPYGADIVPDPGVGETIDF